MVRVECFKCAGKGEIKAFAHVMGGVCFACGGKGFKMLKAPRKNPLPKFAILAKADGEEPRVVFHLKAKNEAAAVAKANGHFAAKAVKLVAVAAEKWENGMPPAWIAAAAEAEGWCN